MKIVRNIHSIDGKTRQATLGADGVTWVPEFSLAPTLGIEIADFCITPEQVEKVKEIVKHAQPSVKTVDIYANNGNGYDILIKCKDAVLLSLFGTLE